MENNFLLVIETRSNRSYFRLHPTSLAFKFSCLAEKVCWDPAEERQGGQSAGVRLTDVNMVAQLLKAFVRELPEPLIPFRCALYHARLLQSSSCIFITPFQ